MKKFSKIVEHLENKKYFKAKAEIDISYMIPAEHNNPLANTIQIGRASCRERVYVLV